MFMRLSTDTDTTAAWKLELVEVPRTAHGVGGCHNRIIRNVQTLKKKVVKCQAVMDAVIA